MRRILTISLAALLSTLAAASDASAKPGAPACGLEFLPFVEGTEWTFEFNAAESPAADPEEAQKGVLKLDIPSTLTIEVVKVAKSGADTEVTLEESFRKVTITTKIRCNGENVQIDPNSFFSAGEPGGGLGLDIKAFKRTANPSFLHTKGKLPSGQSWREDMTFDAERPASDKSEVVHTPAKVEVERQVKVAGSETVGEYKATKIELQLTGRAWVIDRDKSVNMAPANASMWFAPGVGLVRAINGSGQTWELAKVTQPQ
jgi:hypothetical protein